MNAEIASALYRYFEALYNFNRNLITVCGVDVLHNAGQYEKYLEEVIHAVPKLIPYQFNKSTKRYEITGKDGLLEFSNELPFIAEDYNSLLQQHYDLLVTIKKIRNKFEHRMHGVRVVASGSGSISLFDATYKIEEETFSLTAHALIDLAKDLNGIFSKIQDLLYRFLYDLEPEASLYYRRLVRYDFRNFNQIYESELLRNIGKALLPF